MTWNVGILGAGDMGKIHGAILRNEPRVRVAAIADPHVERRRHLAALCNAKPLACLEELLRENLDILFITSPNFTHCEAVLAALEKKLHVFSEKPMALNMQEADQVLDAVRRSGRQYQLGFNRRFAPVYQAVKRKIDEGFTPYVADIKMNEGEMRNRDWIQDPARTGGYLNENTLHFLDMVQWLQGPISEIFVAGRANVYQDMTDFVMTLVTQTGRLASISTSGHATWFYPWERMEVIGDHEALITEEVEKITHSPEVRAAKQTTDFFQLSKECKWGYEGEVKAFLYSIEKGLPSPYSAEMGYEIMQLVQACYQSVRSGQKVIVPPREKGAFMRQRQEALAAAL